MHPLTMFLKLAAEAVRASTPQESAVNQTATRIKQGLTLLDLAAANTPAQQAHALASAAGEAAYASARSDGERLGLAVGNALLLALEGMQHAQSAQQNRGMLPMNSPVWEQAFQKQDSSVRQEFQKFMDERQETQRRLEAQVEAERLKQQQKLEDLRRQLALLRAAKQ